MEKELSTLQKIIDSTIQFFVTYSFQVIGAVIILALGTLAANWMGNVLFRFLQKQKVDITLSKFLSGALRLVIYGFVFIIALGKFGISTAPLIAALSAAAFGASLAVRAPLANYGAGISIILSRPFVVGNTITVKKHSGVVHDISLAATKLLTEDGVLITIPNQHIVGQILYNSKENRIVEGAVGISYHSDPEKAIAAIRETIAAFPEVVKAPAAQVGIETFGESGINLGYRYWIPTSKYYQILYRLNLAVYRALQKAGIEIPLPQREVKIISQPANIK